MTKCTACGKFYAASDGVKCSQCNCWYEKACVGLDKAKKIPASWLCPECVAKKPRTDNTNTPAKTAYSPTKVQPGPSSSSSNNVTEQKQVNVDLSYLSEQLKLVRDQTASMRAELKQFTSRLDTVLTTIENLDKRVVDVESKVTKLEEDLSQQLKAAVERIAALEQVKEDTGETSSLGDIVNVIQQLKNEFNDREQELLLNDLEITGLPEVNGENPAHLVGLVASKLGVTLEASDMVSAERVGTKSEASRVQDPHEVQGTQEQDLKPRPLVVRFVRRALRDKLFREARVRRTADTSGIDLPGPTRRFYLNERLTKVNRKLFGQARKELKSARGWKFVWTRGGRVYARRHKDAEICRIRTAVDITKHFGSA